METTTFKNDGYTLAGHLFKPVEPSRLAFLLIQGWQGHENLFAAEALFKRGHAALTYDMRGNGKSEGDIENFSRKDFVNDSVAAYDYLRSHIGASAHIAVIGSSFGSYTAALLSTQREAHGLSLRVPANYPDDGFDTPEKTVKSDTVNYVEWRAHRIRTADNMALQAVHDFTGPVQIIEAEADETVPHQTVVNYADSISDERCLAYSLMNGAPHRLTTDALKSEYVTLLSDWAATL